MTRSSGLRLTFRILHAAWALAGTAASIVIVFAGGGHPPPIVFLPVVLALWGTGHVVFLGAYGLARRGEQAAAPAARSWPAPVLIAVVGAGLATMLGIVQLVVTLLRTEPYPFRGALWPATMAVWVLHAVAFTGLLSRRPWARPFAAMLAFAWAALAAWQIFDHLLRARPVDLPRLLLAVAIVACLGSLGRLLLRDR